MEIAALIALLPGVLQLATDIGTAINQAQNGETVTNDQVTAMNTRMADLNTQWEALAPKAG